MPSPPKTTRLRPFLHAYFEGFRTPVAGLRYLAKHRNLWRYALIPALINAAISLLLLTLFITTAYFSLNYLHHLPTFAASPLGRIAEFLVAILLLAALLATTAGLYLFTTGLFNATFNEKLAIQVEIQLGTPPADLAPKPFQFHLLDSLRDLFAILATALLSLLIGCIPVVGSLLGPLLNFLIDSHIFGYDALDIPMSLRDLPRDQKRAFAKQHRPQILGLGAAILLMNLIPILGGLLLTTATVGALLLHKKLTQSPPTTP